MEVRPSEIFYSQDSISKYFDRRSRHGSQTIGQTLDQIVVGKCPLSEIPRISVLKLPGHLNKWYSVDNRRLWVFKNLERLGYLDTITVNCTVFNRYLHGRKITTKNGGISVRIRGDGNPEGQAFSLPDNCYTRLKALTDKKRKCESKKDKQQDSQVKVINNQSSSSLVDNAYMPGEASSSHKLENSVKSFERQSNSATAKSYQPDSLSTEVPISNKYQYDLSFSTYRDRNRSIPDEKSNVDRDISEYSDRFGNIRLTDQVKISHMDRNFTTAEGHGHDSVSLSSHYHSYKYTAHETKDNASYQEQYKSKQELFSNTSSGLKQSTIHSASSHDRSQDRCKGTNRDVQHRAVSPDKSREIHSFEEDTIQTKKEKRVVSQRIVPDPIRMKEVESSRDKALATSVTKGFVATKDVSSLSRSGISKFGTVGVTSTSVTKPKIKSHRSFCTEEQVDRNMKLLLHRQRYRELLPDSWSTYSCKAGY